MTEERKFLIHDKTMCIISIVLLCLLLIGAAWVCLANLGIGLCMIIFMLTVTLFVLLRAPMIIVFSSSCLKTKTCFRKTKKTMNWSDLKRIIIKPLSAARGADNYCIFFFTEEELDFDSYEEGEEEEHIILMSYRKGLKEIIKEYTAIEIDDHLIKR